LLWVQTDKWGGGETLRKIPDENYWEGSKGFLKQKNIHTCTANIITCLSQAWQEREGCGLICVDFKKAFDSVEHEAIEKILQFFNSGEYMVGMVMTSLNGRKSRVIAEYGYSESVQIARGTP
jgi:hypothetical protein